MGRSSNAKNRREGGTFVPFPHRVLLHSNFTLLSSKAVKLLIDMASQLRFDSDGPKNNGDITVAFSVMELRGWCSKETLQNAIRELEYYGFIKLTRQGGKRTCSLYALTWWAINDCGGKLDVQETATPSNEWKVEKEVYRLPRKQKVTNSVPRNNDATAPIIGAN